jgi:hypothetical protein
VVSGNCTGCVASSPMAGMTELARFAQDAGRCTREALQVSGGALEVLRVRRVPGRTGGSSSMRAKQRRITRANSAGGKPTFVTVNNGSRTARTGLAVIDNLGSGTHD